MSGHPVVPSVPSERTLMVAMRAGAASASLTLAGRNLHTWTKYTGLDPELNAGAQANFATADFLTAPQVRYFTARLAFTF